MVDTFTPAELANIHEECHRQLALALVHLWEGDRDDVEAHLGHMSGTLCGLLDRLQGNDMSEEAAVAHAVEIIKEIEHARGEVSEEASGDLSSPVDR